MKIRRSAFAAIALSSALSQAEVPSVHASKLPINFAAVLSLDTSRAQVVEAILENAHQRRMAALQQIGRPADDATRGLMRIAMEAIRQDTDKQLAAVLTAAELVKLKEALPPPFASRDIARLRGTPM
jgi:hypothetical protein